MSFVAVLPIVDPPLDVLQTQGVAVTSSKTSKPTSSSWRFYVRIRRSRRNNIATIAPITTIVPAPAIISTRSMRSV